MPRGDGTGPFGLGQLTGRGLGSCKNPTSKSNFSPFLGFGRGFCSSVSRRGFKTFSTGKGFGFGRGFGFGNKDSR